MIPAKVKEELEDIAGYGDEESQHAKNILGLLPDKIRLSEVKNKQRVRYLVNNFLNIDVGEAEVLVLAEEKGGVAVTDDLRSLPALKENAKVQVYLSAYLFAGLIMKKLVKKEGVLKAFERLAEKRDWKHSALYTHSKKYIEEL